MTIGWVLQQIKIKYADKCVLIVYADESGAIEDYRSRTKFVFNNLSELISHLQEN